MASSIKAKLFAAASNDAGLVALLQDGANAFRWFDQQLPQVWPATGELFPAVVVTVVSNPQDYVVTGPLPTSWARVQFTIYGTGNDSENANAIAQALFAFLTTFNAYGLAGSVPANANFVVGDRDAGIAKTQPMTFQRIIDARILVNSEV